MTLCSLRRASCFSASLGAANDLQWFVDEHRKSRESLEREGHPVSNRVRKDRHKGQEVVHKYEPSSRDSGPLTHVALSYVIPLSIVWPPWLRSQRLSTEPERPLVHHSVKPSILATGPSCYYPDYTRVGAWT